MKKSITLTNKNIVKIFEQVRKKLDRLEIPPTLGGFINTPYGTVYFHNEKIVGGSKKARKWVRAALNLK